MTRFYGRKVLDMQKKISTVPPFLKLGAPKPELERKQILGSRRWQVADTASLHPFWSR